MKIIFLDNDGVICLSNNWGSRFKKESDFRGKNTIENRKELPVGCRFDNFDKKAIKVLNEIIEKTNANIVVSSDWRHHATLEELGEYYTSQGIIRKPVGVTKIFNECEILDGFEFIKGYGLEQERSIEIKQFLIDNPEITHWVAVDDLNMGKQSILRNMGQREWGLKNFVHTPKSNEGIKQSGVKEKIISFLD